MVIHLIIIIIIIIKYIILKIKEPKELSVLLIKHFISNIEENYFYKLIIILLRGK